MDDEIKELSNLVHIDDLALPDAMDESKAEIVATVEERELGRDIYRSRHGLKGKRESFSAIGKRLGLTTEDTKRLYRSEVLDRSRDEYGLSGSRGVALEAKARLEATIVKLEEILDGNAEKITYTKDGDELVAPPTPGERVQAGTALMRGIELLSRLTGADNLAAKEAAAQEGAVEIGVQGEKKIEARILEMSPALQGRFERIAAIKKAREEAQEALPAG